MRQKMWQIIQKCDKLEKIRDVRQKSDQLYNKYRSNWL